MKKLILVLLFVVTTGAYCGKRVNVSSDVLDLTECEDVVDTFYTDFRQPTPKEFKYVLDCLDQYRELIRN